MPIIAPLTPVAYDTVTTVMNAARVRLGADIDALTATSGKFHEGSTQAFGHQAVNSAWRRLQEHLANLGYSRLRRQIVLAGFPPVGSTDPSTQTFLNWFEYFNGTASYTSPVLPPDLIIPLRIWERLSGSNAPFGEPMDLMLDGLPGVSPCGYNRMWEWRDDSIFMPGSTRVMDLQIAYSAYLPDFTTVSATMWYEQPVPLMRSLDAFAWFICAEVEGKSPEKSQFYLGKGEAAANLIMNRDVRLKQRVNVRRSSRSGRQDRHGF